MDTEAFLTAARELLAVPSTYDRPDELSRALDLVLGFAGPGFTVERFESNTKPSALVYHGAQRSHFRVILNAHLDVVPAAPHQFQPRREGDRLYARGAQDMKLSALAQAQVFRELAGRLPYPIALQLVTDEEVGGRDGTLHQLEQGVRGEFVIIGEHSGLEIVTESKGIISATLRATGHGAHSAYQWLGDNALVKLQRSVDNVLARYPVVTEEAWRTTVNLARIETPNTARNQIPELAEAWLDIRFPPEDADFNGKSADEITAYLAVFCEPGVTPVVDYADPPHRADQNRPEVRSLQQAARNQGYRGGFLRKHGAGDARFYYQQGVNAVAFGIGGDGQHGAGRVRRYDHDRALLPGPQRIPRRPRRAVHRAALAVAATVCALPAVVNWPHDPVPWPLPRRPAMSTAGPSSRAPAGALPEPGTAPQSPGTPQPRSRTWSAPRLQQNRKAGMVIPVPLSRSQDAEAVICVAQRAPLGKRVTQPVLLLRLLRRTLHNLRRKPGGHDHDAVNVGDHEITGLDKQAANDRGLPPRGHRGPALTVQRQSAAAPYWVTHAHDAALVTAVAVDHGAAGAAGAGRGREQLAPASGTGRAARGHQHDLPRRKVIECGDLAGVRLCGDLPGFSDEKGVGPARDDHAGRAA